MIERFDEWRDETIRLGDIVQDNDRSVPLEEAGRRFRRYVELVHMVEGGEGPRAVAALVASMRAVQDYGAYQATHEALAKFPPADFLRGVVLAIRDLVTIPPDRSGEVLLAAASLNDEHLREFNSSVSELDLAERERFRALVLSQEEDGWLSEGRARGRLRP